MDKFCFGKMGWFGESVLKSSGSTFVDGWKRGNGFENFTHTDSFNMRLNFS